jgi:hypothetical protein
MMEKSAQPGEGGVAGQAHLLSLYLLYFRVHKVVVNDPVEREDTKPYFHSTPMCTM